MAAMSTSPMLLDNTFQPDLLTNEIFSILENKFLFGCDAAADTDKFSPSPAAADKFSVHEMRSGKHVTGRVRILSIDGAGATHGLLAAKSLVRLESSLRRKSGNPAACIADYFDVVAGSGVGGILAALLFTRGPKGGPIFTAEEALRFLVENRKQISRSSPPGFFRRVFQPAKLEKVLRKAFGECTLKDTLKSVLIPCYDLSSRAPFLFSRADAVEIDGYDFKMRDVCLATSVDPTVRGPVALSSVDGRTKILAVDGGIAMNNPTAAAITHVLNNKQEYPFCTGVDDLMVVSLGNGESTFNIGNATSTPAASFLRIAGEGTADMVDQAVSMAFGQSRTTNYVRIQGNGIMARNLDKTNKKNDVSALAEEMLGHQNVESVLFEGKKMVKSTNSDKLEQSSGELIKEELRRKSCILPTVVLKQSSASPRTSSATTLSSLSSSSS